MKGPCQLCPVAARIVALGLVIGLLVAPQSAFASNLRFQAGSTLPPPPPITPATPVTPSPTPTTTPTATPTQTANPTPTAMPTFTNTPLPTDTAAPEPTATDTATAAPSPEPSSTEAPPATSQPGEPACLSTVLGTVTDQYSAEPQVHLSVRLQARDGTIWATTTTDTNGAYIFAGLCPGMVRVVVLLPSGQPVTNRSAEALLDGRNTARLDLLVGGDLAIPVGPSPAQTPAPTPTIEPSIPVTGLSAGLIAAGLILGMLVLAIGGARRWLRRST
jgi:hypothetical protein